MLIRPGRFDRENWLDADVEVMCDGWTGVLKAYFLKGELGSLAEQLRALYKNLSGAVELNPIEPYLTLSFSGDGKGHIIVKGEVSSPLGSGTYLRFAFEIDQTYLKSVIDALAALDSAREVQA